MKDRGWRWARLGHGHVGLHRVLRLTFGMFHQKFWVFFRQTCMCLGRKVRRAAKQQSVLEKEYICLLQIYGCYFIE